MPVPVYVNGNTLTSNVPSLCIYTGCAGKKSPTLESNSTKNQVISGPVCYPEKWILAVLQSNYSSTLPKSGTEANMHPVCSLKYGHT
jgi:hypothetical protein